MTMLFSKWHGEFFSVLPIFRVPARLPRYWKARIATLAADGAEFSGTGMRGSRLEALRQLFDVPENTQMNLMHDLV
jgi:hypothetical protein